MHFNIQKGQIIGADAVTILLFALDAVTIALFDLSSTLSEYSEYHNYSDVFNSISVSLTLTLPRPTICFFQR
jgi:hypothetical protein